MFQQGSGEILKTARERTLPKREMPQVAQLDALTLRQWFYVMDVDRDGSITRHDCFSFFIKNPKFRDMLLCDSSQPLKNGLPHLRQQSFQMMHVMKLFDDVFSSSNMMNFEEFAECVRHSGRLAENQNVANTRMQMDVLADVEPPLWHRTAEARVQLAKQNLPGIANQGNGKSRQPKNSGWVTDEAGRLP